MPVSRAIQTIRRLAGAPLRRARGQEARGATGPDFSRVNAIAGTEPIRPALRGLRSRRLPLVGWKQGRVHLRMMRLLIPLGYRWQPSEEYRRRQGEMREMNGWLKRQPRMRHLPPIFLLREETDVAPMRLQPLPGHDARTDSGRASELLPLDLGDLDGEARQHLSPTLRPRLPETDPEDLVLYRALLPRQCREFLRSSPYPRVAVAAAALVGGVLGVSWINQVQHAEAVAASRLHMARNAFRAELESARAYGVDSRALQWLEWQARRLGASTAPFSFIPSHARERFYTAQEHRYAALRREVRLLERRALAYWTWKEGVTFSSLVGATRTVHDLGLTVAPPRGPACRTPHCLRAAVAWQEPRAAWLRETAGTLRTYAAAIRASQDPVSSAGAEVQETVALSALLPGRVSPPARIAELEGMYATSTGKDVDARVGALAHLDVDVLHAALLGRLPGRSVVVSVEDQRLTCYERGRDVYHTPVTASATTPTGIFHIQAKEISVPALYWNQVGDILRYRYGSLPDWMPFSGGAALQGAPWRSLFGPGSDAVRPRYAPATPGSIDLPPPAARFLFNWVSTGTEVVVY